MVYSLVLRGTTCVGVPMVTPISWAPRKSAEVNLALTVNFHTLAAPTQVHCQHPPRKVSMWFIPSASLHMTWKPSPSEAGDEVYQSSCEGWTCFRDEDMGFQ